MPIFIIFMQNEHDKDIDAQCMTRYIDNKNDVKAFKS